MTTTTTTMPTEPAPPEPSIDPAVPGTHLPVRQPLDTSERKTSTATLRATDFYAVVGALLASLSLVALLFTFVLPFNGPLGFVVCTFVGFLAVYALLVSFDESGPAVRDRLAAVV